MFYNVIVEKEVLTLDKGSVFRRYELKFIINNQQYNAIIDTINQNMELDEHGKSLVCNLYFDTSNSLLIRRSIEKPVYKEKIRLRSYGIPKSNDLVFIELKNKYDGIVYKRRMALPEKQAMTGIISGQIDDSSQIAKEINYFLKRYGKIEPSVVLSYQRSAYYGIGNHDLRLTFDTNLLYRDYDLNLTKGIYGTPLLGDDEILMEVKSSTAFPLWLVHELSSNKIYKRPFSKYGMAYQLKKEA